ncbi:elpc-2 [Pristionchus pacificus]|nr:elpc-2 [Pristionchus pacificus]
MGTIRLWKILYREGVVCSLDEEIVENEAKHFFLSLDIQRIITQSDGDSFVVCAGTSKRWIDIYSGVIYPDSKIEKSLTLKDAHDDWVHALEFDENEHEPILASSGQDSIVKLWRFERIKKVDEDEEKDVVKRLEVKRIKVEINDQRKCSTVLSFLVHIHAVLSGHEDWVHSVHWHPKKDSSGGRSLVTASSDKAVVMWTRMENGVWADMIRLGIIGGQATGFYGVVVCADGETIVGSSYYGGLHAWKKIDDDIWVARPLGGGHCGRVSDVIWSRGGQYLLSTSSDNTTRMHTRYGQHNEIGWTDSSVSSLPSLSPSISSFVEIGRPQVHGHEIECIATLYGGIFISGSEEKILRVFEMPRTVAESLAAIAGEESLELEGLSSLDNLAWGASVPALGLSNTAIEKGDGDKKDDEEGERHWEEEAFVSVPQALTGPPTEECLQQNTLWPETHKLYGHGFELFAIAAHPDSGTVVSASRASQGTHAALLQWTPPMYTEAPKIIPGHSLTVTQCEFSPDGQWLLSVSRDRTVIVYATAQDGEWRAVYQSASKGGPHSRIIWSCAWFHDSTHFVTVSREGKVILWKWNGETAKVVNVYSTKQSVTAVGVSTFNGDRMSDNVVVIGFESGAVDVLRIDDTQSTVLVKDRSLIGIPEGEENAEEHTVTRIRFCPRPKMDSPVLVGVSTANKKLHVFELCREVESVV